MSKRNSGNHLLYLLSEKKTLKWNDFKKYIETLYGGKALEKDKYFILNLSRNLNSFGYIDIGKDSKDNTIVTVTPPMLIALPYMAPTFLLTGACCPELLHKIKEHFQSEIRNHEFLPNTIIIKPENIEDLEDQLQEIVFQGNKLSDYIRICKTPVAWSLLEFSGSLVKYKESLNSDCSGDSSHIKEAFDIKTLKFKPFQLNLKNNVALVKIYHFKGFYKYYLFSIQNQKQKKVEVDLDWGKFFIINQHQKQVLNYNPKNFEFSSALRLPLILERGLTLLSGLPLKYEKRRKAFVFKNVPDKIAQLVAEKLGQKLKVS